MEDKTAQNPNNQDENNKSDEVFSPVEKIDSSSDNPPLQQKGTTQFSNEEVANPVEQQPAVTQPPETTQNPQENQNTTQPSQEKIQVPSPLAPLPNETEAPKSKKHGKFLMIFIMLLLFFIISVGSAAALIAYEVLPLKDENLKNKITDIVMKIPYIPRPKAYILRSMVKANETVESLYVDASIASSISGLQEVFGMADFDMSLKGPIDMRDKENPKLAVNVNVTNQLDLDFTVLDNYLYFRVNEIPTFVKSMFGTMTGSSFENVLNVWVQHNISPFESDAREALDEFKETEETAEKPEIKVMKKILQEDLLPEITKSEEDLDGFDTYKFSLKLDKEQLKELGTKISDELDKAYEEASEQEKRAAMYDIPNRSSDLSTSTEDYIESVNLSFWVDKNDYYTRKVTVIMRFDGDAFNSAPYISDSMVLGDSTTSEPVDVTFVLKMTDFGKDFDIKAPSEYVDSESWLNDAFVAFGMSGLLDPTSQAAHAQFLADFHSVKTSILMSWVNNNTPPSSYEDISEYVDLPPDGIDFVKIPDQEIVLIYGYDPRPDAPERNFLITLIDNTSEESEEYYNMEEAEALFDSYGLSLDLNEIIPIVPLDDPYIIEDPTEIPVVPEESGSDTPFGEYLN